MGKSKKLILNIFITLTSLLLTSTSMVFANAETDPLNEVHKKIKENTFILVPINMYAPIIPKDRAEEFVKANCHMSHLPPSEVLNCQALKSCVEGTCIREYQSHGTAFLIENGQTLKTAWHVVYPTHAAALLFIRNYALSITEQERNELYQYLTPKFVLLNHDHEIVYDARQDFTEYENFGDPLSTTHMFYGFIRPNQPYGYYENIPEDYLEIKLSKNLGEGLKFAPFADENDEFLVSGFGYDGQKLKFEITSGHRQSLSDLKTKTGSYLDFVLKPFEIPIEDFLKLDPKVQLMELGYSEESAIAQIEEHGLELINHSIYTVLQTQLKHMRDLVVETHEHALFTNNPALPGFSGGPATNSKGEVVGILTNGILSSPKPGEFVSHGAGVYLFVPLNQ